MNKEIYNTQLNDNYFESEEFTAYYISNLRREINDLIHREGYSTQEGDFRVYYAGGAKGIKNYKFLVIYKPRNKIYTNVDYTVFGDLTLDAMRYYIENKEGEKVKIIDGKVVEGMNSLKLNWEDLKTTFDGSYYYTEGLYYDNAKDYEDAVKQKAYEELESKLKEVEKNGLTMSISEAAEIITDSEYNTKNETVYVDYSIEDFEIYTTYEKAFELSSYDEYVVSILKILQNYENAIYVSVPICGILSIIIIAYLVMAIGYRKDKKGIDFNDIDRIPFEIVLIIVGIACLLIGLVTDNFYYSSANYYKLFMSEIITAYFVVYILCAIVLTTLIKRIKAKTFIKNTITYKTLRLIGKTIKRIKKGIDTATENIKLTWKILLEIFIYILVMICVFGIFEDSTDFAIFLNVCITIYAIYKIIKRANCFKKIEEQLRKIYEGDNKERLDEECFTKEFTASVRYINDISNGFENAVEEGIKSERLKTELITNVSHDIKTPLTSIINYVDLLKRENIENEKVAEYIEILEAKSLRLKRLTEDLVEASKASSGNVKLNLERLNLGELINQTTGEFQDKFKTRNLELVVTLPEEDIYIEADSRYLYRIIENIFSNVSKYALINSRVYIDMIKKDDKVTIEVKNVSEAKLNISEEELMQRFVRGDKSRFTEGSGLGLSISKSLAELQKGKFEIHIDGDLFKVEIEFQIKN